MSTSKHGITEQRLKDKGVSCGWLIDLMMLYMPQRLQMMGEMGRWLILVNRKNKGRKLWWCV
jgi:hypothetical protein